MLRLVLLGADTQLGSSLCAECPQGPAGCCVAPPEIDFSDVGRIVTHGGRDFLLEHIVKKNLIPSAKGLRIRRVKRRESKTEPLERKCVFHGKDGCTIETTKRPATCNYFLCEDTFRKGAPEDQKRARDAHQTLRTFFARVDDDLLQSIQRIFPEGPPWNAQFLDWLGESFAQQNNAKIP